jgi:prophage DNA circulation protein
MSRFFNKAVQGTQRFFNKVSQDAPRFLGKISSGLGSVGNVIQKVGNIASSFANNPLTMAIAPELSAGVNSLTSIGRNASNLLHQGSDLTNAKTYRGNSDQVGQKVLERVNKIKNDGMNIRVV